MFYATFQFLTVQYAAGRSIDVLNATRATLAQVAIASYALKTFRDAPDVRDIHWDAMNVRVVTHFHQKWNARNAQVLFQTVRRVQQLHLSACRVLKASHELIQQSVKSAKNVLNIVVVAQPRRRNVSCVRVVTEKFLI